MTTHRHSTDGRQSANPLPAHISTPHLQTTSFTIHTTRKHTVKTIHKIHFSVASLWLIPHYRYTKMHLQYSDVYTIPPFWKRRKLGRYILFVRHDCGLQWHGDGDTYLLWREINAVWGWRLTRFTLNNVVGIIY